MYNSLIVHFLWSEMLKLILTDYLVFSQASPKINSQKHSLICYSPERKRNNWLERHSNLLSLKVRPPASFYQWTDPKPALLGPLWTFNPPRGVIITLFLFGKEGIKSEIK